MWLRRATLAGALIVGAACARDDDDAVPATALTAAAPAPTAGTVAAPATDSAATDPAPTAPPVTDAPTTDPATDPATAVGGPATTAATTSAPAAPTSAPGATCPDVPVGITETTLTAGGADHPLRVYVPTGFAGEPLPAVLNWHGLGSNGPQQAQLSDYEALAEAEGFLVVHPTGVAAPGEDRTSWQLVDDPSAGRDDVAFADTLIDVLIDEWCADPVRIYSTGMSNGGFFTARLVCELADRIAAAASIAGTYHLDDCAPARAVPYLAFHGTADVVVPFAGGGESVLVTDDDPVLRAFFEQVMPEEFAEFAADAGCSLEPTTASVGSDVIRHDYEGCRGGTPMAFFEVTGGGHTWPGSPLAAQLEDALGYTTDDVDATADSWAFFRQHTLDG